MRRWLPLVAMAVVLVVALTVGVGGGGGAAGDEARVRDLAASVRCPTCRSQSVLESDAPAADNVRREIARRVEAGETDDEVRAYLVSRYGQTILLNPPAEGVAGLVWALPVAGLVVGAGALALAVRRWRAAPRTDVTDEDRRLVEQARRAPRGPA